MSKKLVSCNTLCVIVFAYTDFSEFCLIYFLIFSRVQIFSNVKFSIFLIEIKKLSTMWTSKIEIEACLDSRIFGIKELRILFRGNIKFSKFDFFHVHFFS